MQLITERLRLRDFVEGDWEDVLAYQSDARYLRYYEWDERTPEAAQSFVNRFVACQREKPRTKYQLTIVHKDSNRLLGSCGIRKASALATEAELGYELAPDYWGRGYATEAARTLVSFGFRELGLHRILSQCIAENVASVRVLERLGMRLEGRLREKDYFKGRWWDVLLFGLLESEWQQNDYPQRLSR